MATIIFDFDSTLISLESLEEVLRQRLEGGDPSIIKEAEALTNAGMSGLSSFSDSLKQRLALSPPTLQDLQDFGNRADQYLTEGIRELIEILHRHSIVVWIISGGMREVIEPVGLKIGIPKERIGAVQLLWEEDGSFAGIDPNDPFSHSKLEGARTLKKEWSHPIVAIGDGITDYALFEGGLADYFIAFTEHVDRKTVREKTEHIAHNISSLRAHLEELLSDVILSERKD